MLTRRSRKEAVASPSEANTSSKSKRSATPSKNKKPVTPRRRSKSKSIDRKIRTRSRSVNKSIPVMQVVLERFDNKKQSQPVKKKETKSKIVKHCSMTLSVYLNNLYLILAYRKQVC